MREQKAKAQIKKMWVNTHPCSSTHTLIWIYHCPPIPPPTPPLLTIIHNNNTMDAEFLVHMRLHSRFWISKPLINQRNKNHNQSDAKLHICCQNNCGQSFTTYHKLLLHKNCTSHNKNQKHKAEESKESKNNDTKNEALKKNPDYFLQQKSGQRGGTPKRRRTRKRVWWKRGRRRKMWSRWLQDW